MLNPNTLSFSGACEARIFFDAKAGARALLHTTRDMSVRFEDESGAEICRGAQCRFPADGVYRAILTADERGERLISIEHDDPVMPFLMPGMGVVWNHGAIFPLLPAGNCRHDLYAVCDPSFPEKVCCVKDAPDGQSVRLFTPDGGEIPLDWYPKLNRPWFWMSAELTSDAEYLRVSLDAGKKPVRFTLSGCPILSLVKPARPFRTTCLSLEALDGEGQPLDARFELYAGAERVSVHDRLKDEQPVITLPRGKYTLTAAQGVRRAAVTQEVHLTGKEQSACFTLPETLCIPKGWALGELHTHSSFEDATLFPQHTMRAARANGLNFCFQTDKDVDKLLEYGVSMHDLPGEFIGLPGQEIMCHELHMNVLNVDRAIPNPEANDLTRVNPDIEAKIAGWLEQIRAMQQDRPCAFVLNHPSHRPEVMKNGQPYFRSWWVADVFPAFSLVENCDYERWFDRLNRGRKLYGAWTGDGHDCMLMYPGKEGVCLHVGDELSAESIIHALERGDFISLRAPGAFITLEADGQAAKIHAQGSLPIERVELIADGAVAAAWDGEGRKALTLTPDIPDGARWIMARMKLTGSQWDEKTHSFTPLMVAGFDAFTNPVFV